MADKTSSKPWIPIKEMKLEKKFAKSLNVLRLLQGMTQEEVIDHVGDTDSYCRYDRGKTDPPATKLKCLVERLGGTMALADAICDGIVEYKPGMTLEEFNEYLVNEGHADWQVMRCSFIKSTPETARRGPRGPRTKKKRDDDDVSSFS